MFFIEEIKPRVFCVTFHDHYQLCMTFARVTEAVEGENPKWGHEPFILDDWKEWYSNQGTNLSFEYSDDWAGFNVSSQHVFNIIKRGYKELTKWDQMMMSIWSICLGKYEDAKFSIIGVSRKVIDEELMNHEIAHSFYAMNPKYSRKMDKAFNDLNSDKKDMICQILKSWGYGDDCLVDEAQAYLATGLESGDNELIILDNFIDLSKEQKIFQNIFKEENTQEFKLNTIYPFIR